MKTLTGIGILGIACCAGLPLLAAAITSAGVTLVGGIPAGLAVGAAIIAIVAAGWRWRRRATGDSNP